MFNAAQLVFTAFVALMLLNVEGTTLQYKGNMKHPGKHSDNEMEFFLNFFNFFFVFFYLELDNHCYFTEHKLSIKVNETAFPFNLDKACIRVFCRDDYVLEIKQ